MDGVNSSHELSCETAFDILSVGAGASVGVGFSGLMGMVEASVLAKAELSTSSLDLQLSSPAAASS